MQSKAILNAEGGGGGEGGVTAPGVRGWGDFRVYWFLCTDIHLADFGI